MGLKPSLTQEHVNFPLCHIHTKSRFRFSQHLVHDSHSLLSCEVCCWVTLLAFVCPYVSLYPFLHYSSIFSLQSIWLHFFPWELSTNYFFICTNPLWQLEMKAGLLSPWPFLIFFNAFSYLKEFAHLPFTSAKFPSF